MASRCDLSSLSASISAVKCLISIPTLVASSRTSELFSNISISSYERSSFFRSSFSPPDNCTRCFPVLAFGGAPTTGAAVFFSALFLLNPSAGHWFTSNCPRFTFSLEINSRWKDTTVFFGDAGGFTLGFFFGSGVDAPTASASMSLLDSATSMPTLEATVVKSTSSS